MLFYMGTIERKKLPYILLYFSPYHDPKFLRYFDNILLICDNIYRVLLICEFKIV